MGLLISGYLIGSLLTFLLVYNVYRYRIIKLMITKGLLTEVVNEYRKTNFKLRVTIVEIALGKLKVVPPTEDDLRTILPEGIPAHLNKQVNI